MDGPPLVRPETCVGAVVVHDGQLLLIRRGRGVAQGRWSVPGGRVERGETLAQAVEREVREETGLDVVCGDLVGWVERIGQDHHYVILDFAARPVAAAGAEPSDSPPGPLQAGDDAADAAWVDLDALQTVDLVDGLLQFLIDNGVVGGGAA